MRMYEYMKKENMKMLSKEQQHFVAKVIMNDIRQIVREHNISEEMAYKMYSMGLYGGDRIIGEEEPCAIMAQGHSGTEESF